MSTAGPELPPHLLAKRKRQAEEEAAETSKSTSLKLDTPPEKKKRIVGPALPPALIEERPSKPPNDSDSDSDDEWGPAPPPAGSESVSIGPELPSGESTIDSTLPKEESKLQRDEWMMMPPTQDDLAARMDPTKIRARKFNSGKGARAPGGGGEVSSIWNETPEQKAERLRNEVLGINTAEPSTENVKSGKKSKKDEETARKVKELNEKRGKSLMEQHQGKKDKVEEDDPSKRAFDYEKDVGGTRIGHAQKADLMKRAKGFGSRFSSGSYL